MPELFTQRSVKWTGEKKKTKLLKLLPLRPSLLIGLIGSQMKTKVKGIKIYRTEMKVYKIGIFKWTLHKMVGIPGSSVVKNPPASAGNVGREDPRRREWQLTLVFLLGKSQGQRSLAGYSPQGCKESDTTEPLSTGNAQNTSMPEATRYRNERDTDSFSFYSVQRPSQKKQLLPDSLHGFLCGQ